MAIKAIPMKGRLTGKRIRGFLWAGPGQSWTKKENYFQLEDTKVVTAVFDTPSGSFWIRCRGATCEVKSYDDERQILGTAVIALPHARIQKAAPKRKARRSKSRAKAAR